MWLVKEVGWFSWKLTSSLQPAPYLFVPVGCALPNSFWFKGWTLLKATSTKWYQTKRKLLCVNYKTSSIFHIRSVRVVRGFCSLRRRSEGNPTRRFRLSPYGSQVTRKWSLQLRDVTTAKSPGSIEFSALWKLWSSGQAREIGLLTLVENRILEKVEVVTLWSLK